MPQPSSFTATIAWLFTPESKTRTCPPSSTCRMALSTKLMIACLRRSVLPRISGAAPSTLKVTFLSWAMGSSISTTSWATGAISKRFKAAAGTPSFACCSAKSELVSFFRRSDSLRMISQKCSRVDWGISGSSINSALPLMAVRGVRNSWATSLTKES